MNEIKNTQLKVRVTPAERELIDKYCAKHGLTISEFIRTACHKIFNQEVE